VADNYFKVMGLGLGRLEHTFPFSRETETYALAQALALKMEYDASDAAKGEALSSAKQEQMLAQTEGCHPYSRRRFFPVSEIVMYRSTTRSPSFQIVGETLPKPEVAHVLE
jgi:hypothetical protein